MSSSVTQCPECSTRFRVSDEQMEAHDGIVRCGRCNAVFNATEHLHDDEPSPQLSLPIATPGDEIAATKDETIVAEHTIDLSGINEITTDETTAPAAAVAAEEPTLAQQIAFHDEAPAAEIGKPVAQQRRWPWLIGSLLLLLALSAQALYFYRVEIAAQLPGLKPMLTSYCGLLKCTIPLPKKAELMSIESSDLEADPLQANVITLSALLHNRATYTQAFPSLELSLTDMQDKVVARRTFAPSEYLKTADDEKLGLAANRETSIKLRLDTTDLKPSGYKLFLFYPK
ncbi:MAG: family finger-like [Gallionellaceae bacterium]|nr:MAG: family finger-like [Gallionellaceae bacterium]